MVEFQSSEQQLLHPWTGEIVERETHPGQKIEAHI
jgi:hypothetical protein